MSSHSLWARFVLRAFVRTPRSIFIQYAKLCALLCIATPAIAAPADCIGTSADARAICTAPQPTEWAFALCDGFMPYQYIDSYWCQAAGGTHNGYYGPEPGCHNRQIEGTESTLATLSKNFMLLFKGPTATLVGDTGWVGASPIAQLCWPNSRTWNSGFLVQDTRIFDFTYDGGTQKIWAGRTRGLECPKGTTTRVVNGVLGCARQVPANQCGDGNPILPAVGEKVQVELDGYFEGRRLERFYNSKGSIHHQGFNQVIDSADTLWRDSFDIRLEILTSPYVVAALSMPNGTLQYFRTDGSAVLPTENGRMKLSVIGSDYFVWNGSDVYRFDATGRLVSLTEQSGKSFSFSYSDGSTLPPNGRQAVGPNGENYSDPVAALPVPPGLLMEVTSSFGRKLVYQRDAGGSATQVLLPWSQVPIRFFHYAGKRLKSVLYPDGSSKNYLYNEVEHAPATGGQWLTGIVETTPAGSNRFATFAYGKSGSTEGLAQSTRHAGDVDLYAVESVVGNQVTVVDPLGSRRTKTFADVVGIKKLVSQSQPAGAGCDASTSTLTYDASGAVESRTDFNGIRTCLLNDSVRRLETARVEGLGSSTACSGVTAVGAALSTGSRKISTAWHPDWALETRKAEPKKLTTWVYNGQPDPTNGGALVNCAPANALLPDGKPIVVLCKTIEQATTDDQGAQGFSASVSGPARITSNTYNQLGQLLSSSDARGNVTTFTYYTGSNADYTVGDLQSVTNPVGHITQYLRYDGAGRVLQTALPNGATNNTAYAPNGRVSSSSLTPAGGGSPQTTSYTYDGIGQLIRVDLPDGTHIQYVYDDAHRLTSVTDSAGNTISYTLDAVGNRTVEQYRDPAGTLGRTISRIYDGLNRLTFVIGAAE